METVNQSEMMQLSFHIDESEAAMSELDKCQASLVATLIAKWVETNQEVTSNEKSQGEGEEAA